MPILEYNGGRVEVEEDGFIKDPKAWNEELAGLLAKNYEGIGELTEEHWRVIKYVRDYYQRFGTTPTIRKICQETSFDLKRVYELFPSGPVKGAFKIAGLPKPTGCV